LSRLILVDNFRHARQFPDAKDYWDGNWLNVTARCESGGSRVEVSGSIIHLGELEKLLTGCERLYSTLTGAAALECIEPNLTVHLEATGSTGHFSVTVSITPDHMSERHEYRDSLDQSFLPAIIDGCRSILRRYPIRAHP
jgi:hypothetical protein